jgi:holo-[acyl-carrier protein] synthase
MFEIGIDIVSIVRINKLYSLYGEKFLSKILNPEEIQEAKIKGHFIQSIAGKFAAKEAYIKASSSLRSHILSLLEINVLCDSTNKPYICQKTTRTEDTDHLSVRVSISHEKEYAVAVVAIFNP